MHGISYVHIYIWYVRISVEWDYSFYIYIDQVTPLDIERIGQRMLCSRVSYAALGNLQHAPSFQDVEKGMIYDGKLPKLNKLFTFS